MPLPKPQSSGIMFIFQNKCDQLKDKADIENLLLLHNKELFYLYGWTLCKKTKSATIKTVFTIFFEDTKRIQ